MHRVFILHTHRFIQSNLQGCQNESKLDWNCFPNSFERDTGTSLINICVHLDRRLQRKIITSLQLGKNIFSENTQSELQILVSLRNRLYIGNKIGIWIRWPCGVLDLKNQKEIFLECTVICKAWAWYSNFVLCDKSGFHFFGFIWTFLDFSLIM